MKITLGLSCSQWHCIRSQCLLVSLHQQWAAGGVLGLASASAVLVEGEHCLVSRLHQPSRCLLAFLAKVPAQVFHLFLYRALPPGGQCV